MRVKFYSNMQETLSLLVSEKSKTFRDERVEEKNDEERSKLVFRISIHGKYFILIVSQYIIYIC